MAGVAGGIGLAGCMGGENDTTESEGNTTTTTESEGNEDSETKQTTESTNVYDVTFKETTWSGAPSDQQFNPYAATNYADSGLIFDRLALHSHLEEKWIPLIASDWSVTQEKMTITVNDAYTWQDGTPVRAKDVATVIKFDRYLGSKVADFVSEIRTTDDTTVELTLKETTNPDVLNTLVLPKRVSTKYEIFEEYLKAFENAKTEEEKTQAQEKLTQATISLDQIVGNGPFKIVSKSKQAFQYERYADYPGADGINFARYEERAASSNQKRWQMLTGKTIDGTDTLAAPKKILDRIPNDYTQYRKPSFHGHALQFQFDHPVFGDHRVRQAFAYIMDTVETSKTAFSFARKDEPLTALLPNNIDSWLGDDKNLYISYEQDYDKATQLLQDAGLEKRDGTWYKPDGDVLRVTPPLPGGWDDVVRGMQAAMGQLRQFGIKAQINAVPVGAYFGETLPSQDWGTAQGFWGGFNNHPYFGYEYVFMSGAENQNYPKEVSVPPLGEPDGKERKVNVHERVTELGQTQDQARAKELVKELAWIFNYDIPRIQLYETYFNSPILTTKWQAPSTDDPQTHIPSATTVLPRLGKLKYKGD
jgi:peptide/nickel transport system substrate-binding protein